MNLNEYQEKALTTAFYPGQGTFTGLTYVALKLNGEAGEFAEKIGKIMRDDNFVISPEKRDLLIKEIGDVMWYCAAAARELGATSQETANINLDKLAKRQQEGKLHGSGDTR